MRASGWERFAATVGEGAILNIDATARRYGTTPGALLQCEPWDSLMLTLLCARMAEHATKVRVAEITQEGGIVFPTVPI